MEIDYKAVGLSVFLFVLTSWIGWLFWEVVFFVFRHISIGWIS